MTPTTPRPAMNPVPQISPADFQAWIERRQRAWQRLIAVAVVLLTLLVAAVAAFGAAFGRQRLTQNQLKSAGFMVDWEINSSNVLSGGTTRVIYRPDWSSEPQTSKPSDLKAIRLLNHVQSLDLSGFPFARNDDLALLEALPELEEVHLNRTDPGPRREPTWPAAGGGMPARLTDAALDHLAGLRRLQALGLVGQQITDNGLKKLANLQALEMLNLDETLVTDAGLDTLVGLKSLRQLHVENTKVTRTGVAQFQQKRLDVEVIREDPFHALENPQP
jgi:hypothetical protein